MMIAPDECIVCAHLQTWPATTWDNTSILNRRFQPMELIFGGITEQLTNCITLVVFLHLCMTKFLKQIEARLHKPKNLYSVENIWLVLCELHQQRLHKENIEKMYPFIWLRCWVSCTHRAYTMRIWNKTHPFLAQGGVMMKIIHNHDYKIKLLQTL